MAVIPSYIKNNKQWATTRDENGRSTPFSRIHHIWACINQSAREQPGSMEFSSLGDGHTWKFGQQGNDESEPQEITLRRWSRACHCSIVEFEDTLKGLIFTSDITDSFIANEVSDVKNLAAAPHRQPQNKAWINGYQNRLLDKINLCRLVHWHREQEDRSHKGPKLACSGTDRSRHFSEHLLPRLWHKFSWLAAVINLLRLLGL